MPIPENPQSRSEQYLNAIATGDNSGLPEFPQSRMEQYLDVIAQNGGGGGGGGVLVVNLSENYVCDKTAGEMLAAMETVGVVIKIAFPGDTTIMPVIGGYGKSSGFGFGVETDDGILHFTAETENGYPVLQSDGGE